MNPNKAIKITVEYEDGNTDVVEGQMATLMQARINSAGIMAGIELANKGD